MGLLKGRPGRAGAMEQERDEASRGAGRGSRWLDDLGRDLRFSARALARNPGFALVAVLTIALGVGATTAVVSLTNAVLFRPLPVADPARLFSVEERREGRMSAVMGEMAVPYERYLQYREGTPDLFTGLAAHRYGGFSLRAGGEAVNTGGVLTSGNYFEVLGLRPARGRFFTRDDEAAVVVSYDLWQGRLGGNPGVIGQTVYLDSRPFTVVGVAPRGFGGTFVGIQSELWVPMRAYRPVIGVDGSEGWVVPFGRLRPGIGEAQASSAVDAVGKRIPPDEPQTKVRGTRLSRMTGVPEMGRGPVAGFLGMLVAMAMLVLLIAGANIAGVLLARAVARAPEVAVRLSLGARRGRIVRQLLTESVLLFTIGGAGGVLVALWATRLLAGIHLPIAQTIRIDLDPDLRVLGISLAITMATGLLFGLAPALQASRPDLVATLKSGMPGSGIRSARGRNIFVVAQLAMSVVLLVTAGLFMRSLQSGLSVDPGIDPSGVVVVTTNLVPHGYDEARGRTFYRQLVERVQALPGVESASLAKIPLLTGERASSDVETADAGPAGRRETDASFDVVDPAFFRTMRIGITAGRPLGVQDAAGSPPVVVVNQTLARRLWPGESPLGKRLRRDDKDYEVVGMVRDGRYVFLNEQPTGFAFFPAAQEYSGRMTLHVRTRGNEAETLERVRQVVRSLDPNVATEGAMPLTASMSVLLFPQRFAATLVGIFGVAGLILAGVGIYGVLAFHVAQRTREIGIRMALGAHAREVLRMVVGRGAVLSAVGAGLGVALAAAIARLVQGLLLGVSPLDPITFLSVPLLLLAVGVVASYFPARRAIRVDPMEALRGS